VKLFLNFEVDHYINQREGDLDLLGRRICSDTTSRKPGERETNTSEGREEIAELDLFSDLQLSPPKICSKEGLQPPALSLSFLYNPISSPSLLLYLRERELSPTPPRPALSAVPSPPSSSPPSISSQLVDRLPAIDLKDGDCELEHWR